MIKIFYFFYIVGKLIDFRARVQRCESEPENPLSPNFSQVIAVASLIVLILLFGASSCLSFILLHCKFKGMLAKLTYNLSWQHAYRELEHFASYQQSHLKAPALYGIRYVRLLNYLLINLKFKFCILILLFYFNHLGT